MASSLNWGFYAGFALVFALLFYAVGPQEVLTGFVGSELLFDAAPSEPAPPAVAAAPAAPAAPTAPAASDEGASDLTLYNMNKFRFYTEETAPLKPPAEYNNFAEFLNAKGGVGELNEEIEVVTNAHCEASACRHSQEIGNKGGLVIEIVASKKLFVHIRNPTVSTAPAPASPAGALAVSIDSADAGIYTKLAAAYLEAFMSESASPDITPIVDVAKSKCTFSANNPKKFIVACDALQTTLPSAPALPGSTSPSAGAAKKFSIKRLYSSDLSNSNNQITVSNKYLTIEFTLETPCNQAAACSFQVEITPQESKEKKADKKQGSKEMKTSKKIELKPPAKKLDRATTFAFDELTSLEITEDTKANASLKIFRKKDGGSEISETTKDGFEVVLKPPPPANPKAPKRGASTGPGGASGKPSRGGSGRGGGGGKT